MSDLIDRQAALDAIDKGLWGKDWDKALAMAIITGLPSAEPDGIPLEWIKKHLEWLDNCDNDFAELSMVAVRVMVALWKKSRI